MKIDTSNLEEKLKSLSGLDYEACEQAERQSGNTQALIQFTSGFAVRLAARALGVVPAELKALPLNEYAQISGRVTNFLFTSEETPTVAEEKLSETPSEN